MLDSIFKKPKNANQIEPAKPKISWDSMPTPAVQPVEPEPLVVAKTVMPHKNIKYFIGAIMVLGIGLIAWQWWTAVLSADKTDLRFTGPTLVRAGEKTSFNVVLINKQKKQELRDVSLTLRADNGTEFTEAKDQALYQKYFLESLGPMSEQKEEISAVFWGKLGEERTIEITARYRLGTSSLKLEKTQIIKVNLEDVAIQLTVSLPQQVIAEQDFRSFIEYKKLTSNDWVNGKLVLIPAQGFSLVKSDPEQEIPEMFSWPWEVLANQENQRVVFEGKLSDAEGQTKEFGAQFFVTVRQTEVLINEAKEELSIISNPLALTITASEDPNYAPLPGETINYRINFKNNYEVALKDIVIQADPSDFWFETGSVQANNGGYYSSKDKRIIWTGGTTPQLLVLNPQESGTVSFRAKLQNDYPKDAKQETVSVKAIMSAVNKPKDVGTNIQTEAVLQTKIQGKLMIAPTLFFRDDPQTGFANSGPMPWRANQETQYSLYLTIEALANPFENISFKTILPPNISFDGKIKGDTNETNFVYNPRTNEMSWSIGRLEAGNSKAIVLQLTAIPSNDQIGKLIVIFSESLTTATDAFTSTNVEIETNKISSDFPDDDTVDNNSGRVSP